jgi:hypothetical protein
MVSEEADRYGIRDFNKSLHTPVTSQDVLKYAAHHNKQSINRRELIAQLFRELTYRELKQIAAEVTSRLERTPNADGSDWDVAQTLDDWAHMVKEEDDHANA